MTCQGGACRCGDTQLLDIGTGIPTAGNTHQIAQAIAPESRVVYVDYDPIVLAHARALLTSAGAGATAYIDADLRNTTAPDEPAAVHAPARNWPRFLAGTDLGEPGMVPAEEWRPDARGLGEAGPSRVWAR